MKMTKEERIKQEAREIMDKLLKINEEGTIINKYEHELVYAMCKNKKDYIDILYETTKLIPYPLTITTDPIFHFETHEEFMAKRRKSKQISFYDK